MREKRRKRVLEVLKKKVKDLVLENRELIRSHDLVCSMMDNFIKNRNEMYISLDRRVSLDLLSYRIQSENGEVTISINYKILSDIEDPKNWVVFSRNGVEQVDLPPNLRRLTKKLSKYDVFLTKSGFKGIRIKTEEIGKVM